jgi:hypothetical protein
LEKRGKNTLHMHLKGCKSRSSKSYSDLQDTSCWSRLYKRTSCAYKMWRSDPYKIGDLQPYSF